MLQLIFTWFWGYAEPDLNTILNPDVNSFKPGYPQLKPGQSLHILKQPTDSLFSKMPRDKHISPYPLMAQRDTLLLRIPVFLLPLPEQFSALLFIYSSTLNLQDFGDFGALMVHTTP